ncbi:MAG: HAD-IC family P-type ATPase [Candidatus Hydrogenedentes bacterium]|nr:HAD-IC family P-type ATPase [Candidatus Hydrogenedentota bacterium]
MTLENSQPDHYWHAMPVQEMFRELDAAETGLDTAGAAERLARWGANALVVKQGESLFSMVLRQLRHPLIYLLAGAALISILAGHTVDAAVIACVVAMNTIMGTVQELKAGRAMDALHKLAAPHARVLRGGEPAMITAGEVVPGDILLLETGDRIAADARILDSTELRLDESALTGESEPVEKNPGETEKDRPMADRGNMVWMSTAVTAGRGRAMVVATGMDTALGKIAGQVQQAGDDETPLQARLARLSTLLGMGGLGLSGVVFLLGLLRGYGWLDMVFYALATAVSAIPEGLPAVISVTLALGVQRMTRRNAIIRSLPAVETLGSTTVICSDKTGTITRNEMTATCLWTLDASAELTGGGYTPEGEIHVNNEGAAKESLPEPARLLLRIGVLNNNARLLSGEDGTWQLNGTPTEGAILVAARKAGLNEEQEQERFPRLAEIPFSSKYKYMATLHRRESGDGASLYVKGAPDRMLSFASHVLSKDGPVPLDDAHRRKIEEAIAAYGGRALRLVAAAFKSQPGQETSLDRDRCENGLTFVGFWGILDPPRPEVVDAIRDAQDAGIRIVMITGDHAVTAAAIARDVGISRTVSEAVTGAQLDDMDDEALAGIVGRVNVFARVSPEHKLRLLRALKAKGEIVAMTGDGVNDAPALKGADIGVAMGNTGTEVAREAADMVLTDDNFATIVHAVEEGRVIFSNLQRVVFFLMTTNFGEVLTLSLALMFGLPLPLTAIMILWINLVTDGVCTIPLGVEPGHWNVLKRPPRPANAGVIDAPLLRRILTLAPVMAVGTIGLFVYELYAGEELHAQTVAFTTIAAFQWFQALSARTSNVSVFSVGLFSNIWLWGGILLAVLLQVLVVQTPMGQTLFGVVPLTFIDWILISAVASSIFIADELMKALRRKQAVATGAVQENLTA